MIMRHLQLALTSGLLLIATGAGAEPAADAQVAKILASTSFKLAVQTLRAEHERTVGDIVTLTETPSPPFGEAERAKSYLEMLKAHRLAAVEMDAAGNVMGVRPGTRSNGKGPYVVIAAHLDTVFPAGTDVRVRREGDKLFAPGVGDDTRSLAVLLAYIRAMDAAGIRTEDDLLFVGNVGEEGLGNLRGVRYLFTEGKYSGRIKAFFSMDVIDPALVVDRAIGSKRYRAIFHGPGGHSFSDFGIVNPMAAMAGAITNLYALAVPEQPKTTYSASVTGGGTSVNSIPGETYVDFDLRSESVKELDELDRRFRKILEDAVAAENRSRSVSQGEVTLELRALGDRPAGSTQGDTWMLQATVAAIRAMGFEPRHIADSTDANLPMSLAIPALTIGSGGDGGRAHSLEEWIDVEPAQSVRGMSVGLTAILATAGISGLGCPTTGRAEKAASGSGRKTTRD